MQFSFDTNLNRIAAKVEANERLTFDDGISLSQQTCFANRFVFRQSDFC